MKRVLFVGDAIDDAITEKANVWADAAFARFQQNWSENGPAIVDDAVQQVLASSELQAAASSAKRQAAAYLVLGAVGTALLTSYLVAR